MSQQPIAATKDQVPSGEATSTARRCVCPGIPLLVLAPSFALAQSSPFQTRKTYKSRMGREPTGGCARSSLLFRVLITVSSALVPIVSAAQASPFQTGATAVIGWAGLFGRRVLVRPRRAKSVVLARLSESASYAPIPLTQSSVRSVVALSLSALPTQAWAQSSPFQTGATALQTNLLTIMTPVAVILVIGLGVMAMANRIAWGWVIGAIAGIALAFGAPQIVTWIRGMFGV